MKIVLFITDLSSGGAEHQLAQLGSFLSEKNIDITITTYSDCEDHYTLNEFVKRIRIAEGKSKILKTLFIFKYFITLNADCVISFGNRNNLLMIIPLLLFNRKIKTIAGERCVPYKKLNWIQKINYFCLYRFVDYVVPNSFSQCEDIIKRNPQLKNKTHTIINYTDINLFRVKKIEHDPSCIRIGIFCRYSPEKNYPCLVRAVAILLRKTKTPFEIHWYGSKLNNGIINEYYRDFEELINQQNLGKYIILHDKTRDVANLLPTFDFMCQPSLIEGFSNSISEYICCGKIVVASNVADNSVLVKEGVNGFLFNPKEEKELADSLYKCINLPIDKRHEMEINSRNIAESLFNKTVFVESYLKLINSK